MDIVHSILEFALDNFLISVEPDQGPCVRAIFDAFGRAAYLGDQVDLDDAALGRESVDERPEDVHCRMAIRITRGYRTVPFDMATILARFPALHILVEIDTHIYVRLYQVGGTAPLEVRDQEHR